MGLQWKWRDGTVHLSNNGPVSRLPVTWLKPSMLIAVLVRCVNCRLQPTQSPVASCSS